MYTNALQFGWSILSKNSELTNVVNVLYNPALTPFGGSLVTLIAFYNKPNGKPSLGSQLIHILNESCDLPIHSSSINLLSNSDIKLIPKWQFYNNTHSPFSIASYNKLYAFYPYPSPNDTFYKIFFFFLANSSIDEVGSAPADNKNKTGSLFELDCSIDSIVSVTGSIYFYSPKTSLMNYNDVVMARSSLKDLNKHSFNKGLFSDSLLIRS